MGCSKAVGAFGEEYMVSIWWSVWVFMQCPDFTGDASSSEAGAGKGYRVVAVRRVEGDVADSISSTGGTRETVVLRCRGVPSIGGGAPTMRRASFSDGSWGAM